MAQRYPVTSEKLTELIRLRQDGESWLGIQSKTKVPRRVAKRAYQEWERKRSVEELWAARREVAAAEFRDHLDTLTEVAQLLVRSLVVPTSFREQRDAESVLDDAWKTSLGFILETHREEDDRRPTENQRAVIRRSRMLLQALQNHTHDKVRWKALDEWRNAWSTCIKRLAELKVEATKIMENILNQEAGLRNRIIRGCGKDEAIILMTEGILWEIWQGEPHLDLDCPLVRTRSSDEGRSQLIFGKNNSTYGLSFETGLAEKATTDCNWAAQNLSRGQIVQQVADELGRMRARSEELEEMLDPLILRPLMLRTHCDLCPI